MNNPNQNNYIQYVTESQIIKAQNVVFENDGTNTRFVVQGISEPYFILSVFQNNIRVLGVGFDDIENNDMLGFLNSELSDISLIPPYAFLPPMTPVTMSYNNEYMRNQQNNPNIGLPTSQDSAYQKTNEFLWFDAFVKRRFTTQIENGMTYEIKPYHEFFHDGNGKAFDQFECLFVNFSSELPVSYVDDSLSKDFTWVAPIFDTKYRVVSEMVSYDSPVVCQGYICYCSSEIFERITIL